MATIAKGFALTEPEFRAEPVEEAGGAVFDRSIGDIIREARGLNDEQIENILRHQRANGLRFGEAAVELSLATSEDVLWALSQQFHYPYASHATEHLDAELVAAVDPFGEMAEIFRELRTQLLADVLSPDRPRRALAVLSANSGDGKSFFAANLAVAFSQLGGRTLLVDADMRTPRLHQMFRVGAAAGLSSILSGRTEASVVHQVPNLSNLYLLPVGTLPPNPLELVQRPAFSLLLQELLIKFDYIIVDTPAAEHGADARVLASKCGAALVIGRKDRTAMHALQALVASVSKGPMRMAGVLVNEH